MESSNNSTPKKGDNGSWCEREDNLSEVEKEMSPEEQDLIHRLHQLLGDRWSLISGRLPNRQAAEVERYWMMRKKQKELGKRIFKPICHRLRPPPRKG
ncbi:hypothetical protein AMTRI_Chr11g101690 [Amborella trichopoda]